VVILRKYNALATDNDRSSLRSETGRDGGFALLMVLLIVTVLAAMVTEFMFTTRLHAEFNSNYRNRARARYLARSAVNSFQYLLEVNQIAPGGVLYSASNWVGYGSGFDQVEGADLASSMLGLGESPISPASDGPLQGQWSIGLPSRFFDVDGEIFGRIVNERGKINLNAIVKVANNLDRTQDTVNTDVYNILRALLQLQGIEDKDALIFLDSLVDWIDGNGSTEPNGAEDDYYRGLPENPYYARNDFLLSLDEVRLVKGCTPELFDKIKDFVTVYPRIGPNPNAPPDSTIDASAAPKMVLMAVFLGPRAPGSDTPTNDPDTASRVADDFYKMVVQKAGPSVTVQNGQVSFSMGQTISSQDIQKVIAGRIQGVDKYFYTYNQNKLQYYTAIGAGRFNNVVSVIHTTFKKTPPNNIEILQWIED